MLFVADVGGSYVKCIATGQTNPVRFKSAPKLAPNRRMRKVLEINKD
jgi:polyphosphate glucokinase